MSNPAEEYGAAPAPPDHAGLRRGRRAFRYSVAACVFFGFTLWFAEGYLRFDRAETQYRMSLTLHEASARPVLRNVVKRDAEMNDAPSAKYVEALAAVEEPDMVLEVHEQAMRLNPRSSFLIINYGCALFLADRPAEARERFREASLHPPRNALPRYLEAAALLASMGEGDDLSEVIALVARANSGMDPVVFPKPLWHATLPESGRWHAKLARNLVGRCLAPLYRLNNTVMLRAEGEIADNDFRDWDAWLAETGAMGRRIAGNPGAADADLGAAQAVAGLRMQLDALLLRRRIADAQQNAEAVAEMDAQRDSLQAAMDRLTQFENRREDLIEAHAGRLFRPLPDIAAVLGLFLGLYLLLQLLCKFLAASRDAKSLAHLPAGRAVHTLSILVWLFLLTSFTWSGRLEASPESGLLAERLFWYWTILLLCLVSLISSWQMRRCPRDIMEGLLAGGNSAASPARKRINRIGLFLGLERRGLGTALGVLLCALSLWVVGHRLVTGLYPFQLTLLTTGLEAQEAELVREILRALAG